MADAFIGEIRLFAFDYVTPGWLCCDGTKLQIADYQALFAVIGIAFGGDGVTTFALPDLRGKAPMQAGLGPGLSARTFGQQYGEEAVALQSRHNSGHSHIAKGVIPDSATRAKSNTPSNTVYPASVKGCKSYKELPVTVGTMSSDTISLAGGESSLPHENMQPYLALRCYICWEGIYPPRPE